MSTVRKAVGTLSAGKIRSFGFGLLLGSVAFASFMPFWPLSVLAAAFVMGLGIGLGDWEGGE